MPNLYHFFAFVAALGITTTPSSARATDVETCRLYAYDSHIDQCELVGDETGSAPVELSYGTLHIDSIVLKIVRGTSTSPEKFAELASRLEFMLQATPFGNQITYVKMNPEVHPDRLTFGFPNRNLSSLYISSSRIQPIENESLRFQEVVREIFGSEAIAILIATPRS